MKMPFGTDWESRDFSLIFGPVPIIIVSVLTVLREPGQEALREGT